MLPLYFRRMPLLYLISVCVVLFLHAHLCYPAAISRGYPPMPPFDLVAIFLAPAGMLLPPLFDDFQNDSRFRLQRSVCVTAAFCIVWGVVATNVNDARPHFGHLAGVVGILKHDRFSVGAWTGFYFLPALAFFYCLEGVAIGFRSLVRRFPMDEVDLRQLLDRE